MITRRTLLAAASAAPFIARAAQAQRPADELRVGLATEWTSLDPHYHSFPANLSISHHVFEALTATDVRERAVPALAESWRALGRDGWEFRLRAGAKFADGMALTAADVKASLERVPRIQNSPGPLTVFTRPIAAIETPDPRTLIIRTREPSPNLPIMLSAVYVIPAAHAADATGERFNTVAAIIGSGPFRFASWQRGDRLIMEPNPNFTGPAVPWRRVEYRIMTNTASREAALLAGDIDFIQSPSTTSVPRLRADQRLKVVQAPSTRITYMQFHQGPQALEDLRGTDGRNPFADARVRRAVSLCLPRQAIAERVMEGLSVPSGQIVAPDRFGFDASLGIEPFDQAQARALLEQAGFGGGFEVALSTPNDRNINGVAIAQATAQSLARVGVRVNVNAVPLNVWLTQWRGGRYSFLMHGFGPPLESLQPIAAMVHTKNTQAGLGVSNESGFSNAELDRIIEAALAEIDDAARERLMRAAAQIVRRETAVICVHHEMIVYASRAAFAHVARGDERLYATDITRA